MASWTLSDRGRSLVVTDDGTGAVVLTVDGRDVLARTAGPLDTLKADLGEVDGTVQQVRIEVGLRRSVRQVVLVERSTGGARAGVLFVPPAGTRARRLHDLRELHPRAFAARHVAATLVGFLGIGALISAFLAGLWARIDWSWLPDLPTLSLPDWELPEWLRHLTPWYWLRDLVTWLASLLPDWDWFQWWPDWQVPWARYVVPLAIAVVVAGREVERRQARARREAAFGARDPRDAGSRQDDPDDDVAGAGPGAADGATPKAGPGEGAGVGPAAGTGEEFATPRSAGRGHADR